MWQKKIQYSHTYVTEEGPEVDLSRRQIKDYRICKDYKKKIQKMAKTNRRCSRKQRLQKKILKMNIREDFPSEINDEDVRQVFQNFLWHIESHQTIV